MKRTWLFVATACLVGSGVAWAHHGDAGRYNEEVVMVTGAVVQVQFLNPHSMIIFEVTEPDGKKVKWQAEMGGGQQLTRNFGWTTNTLKPGTMITLTGRRPKSGAPYLNMTERANIVLADGGKEIYRTENYGQPPPK
jgi:hypothetical protein